MAMWLEERLYEDFTANYRVEQIHYREKTEHQDLVIFEHERFGRILALDSIIQVAESEEYIYHEMIAHTPIFAHGAARRVLIIGGGDGGVLRRCLMHQSVESVTMVEIDRSVIDLSLKYLPTISAGAFDDPRADIVIDDGTLFVARTDQRYDVIIVDSTDPVGPGKVLFEPAFYANVVRCLTPGGVVVTQSGVPLWEPLSSALTHKGLSPEVADFGFYRVPVPFYVGGDMVLGWGSNDAQKRCPPLETLRERFAASGVETRFYTPEVHVGAFAVPPAYTAHLG